VFYVHFNALLGFIVTTSEEWNEGWLR